MAYKVVKIDKDDWTTESRTNRAGEDVVIHSAQGIRINETRRRVWVPARSKWPADSHLLLNGENLGVGSPVGKGGLEWVSLPRGWIEGILAFEHEDRPPRPKPRPAHEELEPTYSREDDHLKPDGEWNFWERRMRPKEKGEVRSPDFDDSLLKLSQHVTALGAKCYETYEGAAPQDVNVNSVPGGFAVSWGWREGEEPVLRTAPRDRRFRDPICAVHARIWYRPTAWRGSGCAWTASVDNRHQDPSGREVVIPILEQFLPPGELMDVVVQGMSFWGRRLPPTVAQAVAVGPRPPTDGRLRMTSSVTVQCGLPAMDPMDAGSYAALKSALSGGGTDVASLEDITDEEELRIARRRVRNSLRVKVAEQSMVISNAQLRSIVERALPGFQVVSDNYGSLNALPEELWDEIIEFTDTETLKYDHIWFSCADFAGDFKSACARLGAKALVIFDYAGGHAYNLLLARTEAPNTISLRLLEPQSDDRVQADPDSGLYQLDGGGLVLAW